MISYKDMTFCREYTCKHFNRGCERSLTEQVEADAAQWWGNENAPISVFTDRPECYEVPEFFKRQAD